MIEERRLLEESEIAVEVLSRLSEEQREIIRTQRILLEEQRQLLELLLKRFWKQTKTFESYFMTEQPALLKPSVTEVDKYEFAVFPRFFLWVIDAAKCGKLLSGNDFRRELFVGKISL